LNLLLLTLVSLLSLTYPVEELSRRLGDFYFRLRGKQLISPNVALVLIDDASLARYGRWPWPRSLLARVVRAASAQRPRALGLDILLSEPEDENDDRDLADTLKTAGNVVLVAKIGGSPEGRLWVEPLPLFAQSAAGVGHAQAELGPDSICRSVPVRELTMEGPRWAFALEVARVAQGVAVEDNRYGLRLGEARLPVAGPASRIEQAGLEAVPPRFLTIDYRGQLSPDQSPPFSAVSVVNLLEGKAQEQLRAKAVLIGFAGAEIGDRLPTPISDRLPMPGVEIHANLVDALLAGRSLQSLGAGMQMLFVLGASLLSTWVVLRWPGARGLLTLAGLLLATYAAGYLLFAGAHRLVEFGPLLCVGLLAGPLAQLENLIVVDRGLTRGLRQLQRTLRTAATEMGGGLRAALRSEISPPVGDLHWKVGLLNQLQVELASLYAFDQTLLEAMQEGLAVFAPDGRLVFRNVRWQQFCERQNWDVAVGLEEFLVALGEPSWRDLPTRLTQARARLESEVHLSGGLWQVRIVRLPATAHAGAGCLMAVVTDLTARLERDRARAEALAFVTHELRTPLVSIQGFAEFLLRYRQATADSEAAATILRESRRLVAMIDTYLDVLRLEAGSRPLRQELLDIAGIVTQVERIVEPLAQAAGIGVRTEMDLDLPSLRGDPALIPGALLNLLSNAVKYSQRGSQVKLRVSAEESAVVFEVWNSGPPIPPQDLARVFEPFYRRPEQEDSTPGWGLGLAFVKRIAERHSGRVEASSEASVGTCFRLSLPSASVLSCEALP
jgi:signal transduction histidine kinase